MDREWHHPFAPYDIQKDFMRAVFDVCEHGQVGILESPTGTGKSLSLICGSLTWLREHRRKQLEGSADLASTDDDDAPAWMLEHERNARRRDLFTRVREREAKLARIRAKEDKDRRRFETGEPPSKKLKTEAVASEEAFALDHYESDDDGVAPQAASDLADLGLSVETRALLEKYGGSLSTAPQPGLEPDDDEDQCKVFVCSRTHSQLSQFVNELRRVKMPGAFVPEENDKGDTALVEEFKHVALGSRKNLCINDTVQKLGAATAINERCLELQQSDTPAGARCKYLPTKDNEVLVSDFKDYALAKIRDMEDFGGLGQRIGICPYYATRAAIKPAEVITLPYPLLLQKAAREALGLSIKNHVVIIDEAHNLMDAIANIYSVSVSLVHLQQARAQLGVYLHKFRNKLKGKNRVYVTQLVRLLDSLTGFLQTKSSEKSRKDGNVQIDDLMTGKGVDQINLYKLMRYLQESKLARKVDGYQAFMETLATERNGITHGVTATKKSRSMPVLTHVQSFLLALTNPAPEGRFFYSRDEHNPDQVILKFLLLDPTQHFKDIVNDARAVILAGGTMSPMSDYTSNLFHYLPESQIQSLSCGHVIPKEQLLARGVAKGRHGVTFDFTYEKRNSPDLMDELGDTLISLAKTIPDGLVVFFPSYAYLNQVVNRWSSATRPSGDTIWEDLQSQKRVFIEPSSASKTSREETIPVQAGSSAVDEVLVAYTAQIATGAGGLLFAVIGGSLSEGINFSDKLGRGIAVVGLPFPNANSSEWKAKMEFLKNRAQTQGSGEKQSDPARDFYENACMRAVNQSIGRAIRHKDDYAAILLFDHRYERTNIRTKLPGWIREGYQAGKPFDQVSVEVSGFFALVETLAGGVEDDWSDSI